MNFSFESRAQNLKRLREEKFDLLVIGGGITGAGVARDAAGRGLKVALVEKSDFASGTSSRSSKLVHGGIRYLENLEFGLVFESLSERANLLKTAPHMVRPLKFYFPVFQGDANGRLLLGLGMWLYDLLALFRAPGFHKSLSRKKLLEKIPFLKTEGLKGGFQYYDASMWDDVIVIEVLRSAAERGAAITNYVEALSPIWSGDRITGFEARDNEDGPDMGLKFPIQADRVVVCVGPWTDELGKKMSPQWRNWLSPSKGVHLIFDLKRIPLDGAMVMSNPEDGRISFVIPRPDFGSGVVIVGTTDGPTPQDPAGARVSSDDVDYLMELLHKYFPSLGLTRADIISAYVGVRPLVGGDGASMETLQKVSREHLIGQGPGGVTVIAGGKYTTYRKIAEEVVEFCLRHHPFLNHPLKSPDTRAPMNPDATPLAMQEAQQRAASAGSVLPPDLLERYGAAAAEILRDGAKDQDTVWPEGFSCLGAQLRHSIHREMTMHLRDFYFRRLPLYATRADHGLPWAEELSKIWASETNASESQRLRELELLEQEASRHRF